MFLAQVWVTRQLCNAKSFDIVHAHSLLPQGLTALFNGKLPVVATSHGADVLELKQGGLYGWLKRKVVQRAAALTANSSVTQAALERLGAPAERIHRVPATPNFCTATAGSVAAIRARFPNSKLLLYVGRLLEQKAVDDILRALAQRRKQDTSLQLMIVGDGADRNRLESLTHELDLGGYVHFIGWVEREELGSYFATADVFISTPKPATSGVIEAQGLVFVEAMAAGLPVIASRCGGIVDAVIDGETGLLVEPGDVAGIADAIRTIVEQPDLRLRLADSGKRIYQAEFSPEVVTRRMLAVYDSVLRT